MPMSTRQDIIIVTRSLEKYLTIILAKTDKRNETSHDDGAEFEFLAAV
jgi:hypothetical protein